MADNSDWIFLGSGTGCHLRILGKDVSAYHARCRLDSSGRIVLEDLGTPDGTSVNQPGRRITSVYLNPADIVYLGSQAVPASALRDRLRGTVPPPPTQTQAPPPPPSIEIIPRLATSVHWT